jgi:hypothetical protein
MYDISNWTVIPAICAKYLYAVKEIKNESNQ